MEENIKIVVSCPKNCSMLHFENFAAPDIAPDLRESIPAATAKPSQLNDNTQCLKRPLLANAQPPQVPTVARMCSQPVTNSTLDNHDSTVIISISLLWIVPQTLSHLLKTFTNRPHSHSPCLACLPPSHVVTGPADCRRHDGHHGKRRHQHSSVGIHSDGGLWRGRNPGSIPGVPVVLTQRFRDTPAFPAPRTKFCVNIAADFRLMNMDRRIGGAESIQISIELNKTVIK